MPKRGNERYAYLTKKRFKELYAPFEYEQHKNPTIDDTQTNVLFVTLTYDTKLSDYKKAWDLISADWNRYVSRLRCKYGRVLTCRVFEASEQGYPHVHAIIFMPNTVFPLFKQYKGNRVIYRIPNEHLANFKKWHSFVDVQGMVHLAEGFKYLSKYVTKSSDLSQKAVTTLALTWGFHKRAYSLGNKFRQEVFKRYLDYDLTFLSRTQTFSGQATLDEKQVRDILPTFLKVDYEKVKMIGILGRDELKRIGGVPKYEWSHGLTAEQTDYALFRVLKYKKDMIIRKKTEEKEKRDKWIREHPPPACETQQQANERREFIKKNMWKFIDNAPYIQSLADIRKLNRYRIGCWQRRYSIKHDMRQMQICAFF